MTRNRTLIITIAAVVVIAALVFANQPTLFEPPRKVDVVRVGVLPDEDGEALSRRYSRLLKYMARETGLKYQLVVPESYADLLRKFANKEIDIAYFGGLTFVKAQTYYRARSLVMRDVDTRFTTYFMIRTNGPLHDCHNLKCAALSGKVLAFGSKLSTSGHLMPRHFLKSEKNIEPESHFGEVRYSGAHDETIYQVSEGQADVGAVNAEIFRTMLRDGRLRQTDLRIIWETPPYPDYVWAINSDMTEDLQTRLRNAFMALEIRNREHARILAPMGTNGFLPAGQEMFTPLKKIAKSLDMLEVEK